MPVASEGSLLPSCLQDVESMRTHGYVGKGDEQAGVASSEYDMQAEAGSREGVTMTTRKTDGSEPWHQRHARTFFSGYPFHPEC